MQTHSTQFKDFLHTNHLLLPSLWTQGLIHYSDNTGLNRFPALTPHLSPASSSSQINIPHRVQRAWPHEQVFRGIWGNNPYLSWFRISHKRTLIPKSLLSLFQFQTAGKEPAQTLTQAGCWTDHVQYRVYTTIHQAKKNHLNVNVSKRISIIWAVCFNSWGFTCTVWKCVCVFITPCMHAAALPTGIRSFRHIFTSSAFKGINIAPAAVAGLNGWLGGEELGGWGWWAECQIQSFCFSCLSPPSLSPFLLWSSTKRGVHGDAVADSPQSRAPEATVPACVLCLEEYMIFSSAFTLATAAVVRFFFPVTPHPSLCLKNSTKEARVKKE